MLRELLTKNMGIKIFAIALAVMLEFYFYSPDNFTSATISAPLRLQNLPPKVVLVKPEVGANRIKVRFNVNGPAPIIEQLKENPPIYEVNLPKELGESYTTGIDVNTQLSLPVGVRARQLSPKSIDFQFEKLVTKSLKVEVPTMGEVASGFKMENITVTPSIVLIEGPESELKDLSLIKTNPFNISGLKTSQKKEVSLDEVGLFSSLGVNVVSVDLRVSPLVGKEVIEGVPISVIAPRGMAATIEPSSATVVVTGPLDQLSSLKKEQLTLLADVKSLKAGQHQVDVTGVAPQDFKVITTSPPRVKVTIIQKEQ